LRDSFVFEDVPLTTFVQLLRDQFGINVVVDQKARDDYADRQIEPLLKTLRTARELQGIAPVGTKANLARAAKPPRQYRATANSAWQRPRVYEDCANSVAEVVGRNKSSQFRREPNVRLLPEPRKALFRPTRMI
jgi:hypothetical protein